MLLNTTNESIFDFLCSFIDFNDDEDTIDTNDSCENDDREYQELVAYVEGVTSDGIWISDAGSGRSWRGVHFRKFSDLNVYGYIYLNEPK